MQRVIYCVVIMLLICATTSYAGTFEVKTGYGFFVDGKDNIVSKYELRKGAHPIKDGYRAVEVASKAELDGVTVYEQPKSTDDIKEEKIAKEMDKLLREQATKSLKDKGEI